MAYKGVLPKTLGMCGRFLNRPTGGRCVSDCVTLLSVGTLLCTGEPFLCEVNITVEPVFIVLPIVIN